MATATFSNFGRIWGNALMRHFHKHGSPNCISNLVRENSRTLSLKPSARAFCSAYAAAFIRHPSESPFIINTQEAHQESSSRRTLHLSHRCDTYSTCWKCNHVLSNTRVNIICDHCSAPQPLGERCNNYFDLLGLPVKFEIDENLLHQNLKDLQRYLHPDRFATRPENEQKYSEDASSHVNRAAKVLHDPYLRTVYLLKLETGDESFNEESDLPTGDLDQEFLSEMMEINEVVASGPNAECDRIVKINDEMGAKINRLTNNIAKAFEKKNYDEVKRHLAQLKFYTNIRDKIKVEQARCFAF